MHKKQLKEFHEKQEQKLNQMIDKKPAQAEEDQETVNYKVALEEALNILETKRYEKHHDNINFDDFKLSSQLFWYSPVPDLKTKVN